MESFNWLDSLEHLANQLRGRHKSIEYITVLNRMLQEHTPWMERDDAPKQLAVALAKLITEGRWRVQPKEEKNGNLDGGGSECPIN
ncbi:MAG: hypothetical protein HZT40_06965 [Candidatus Thiothrix singaporensis]|uniref:Uncharacterized protein n=1 Tax=Candidatus Thiothrix singaporensis TaxID=2799669 RepID=A0A7L6AQI6_9GAMM|nr:MAG: hypothetical protein HZT40_06965 [Candidatus Thiothrix singaporensis]